jgi:hypothetical protein
LGLGRSFITRQSQNAFSHHGVESFSYLIHVLSEKSTYRRNLNTKGACGFQSVVRSRIRIGHEHPLTDTYGEVSDLGIGRRQGLVDELSTLLKCVIDRVAMTAGRQVARKSDHVRPTQYLVVR